MAEQVKPIVGIDIDGCLYPWDVAARETVRAIGCCNPPDTPPQYWNHIKDMLCENCWQAIWTTHVRGVFSHPLSFPQSVEAVKFLESKARVAFITSRPNDVADVTLAWLAGWGFKPYAMFHLGPNQSKAGLLDCVMYVEDKDSNVLDLHQQTDATILVPRTAYNTSVTDVGLARVEPFNHWQEVVKWAKANL